MPRVRRLVTVLGASALALHPIEDLRDEAILQLLITVAASATFVAAIGIPAEGRHVSQQMTHSAPPLPDEGEMPSLGGATQWLNSPPLTTKGLRGKVVVVHFSTFSCINWLRTLPYIRAWATRYRHDGLVVINVQTPEFEFEKDLDNVRRASKAMHVDYPTAVDNDFGVWNAFHNHYWPALYIIDAKGRIRHHKFGEGDYEQSERIIRQLLAEAGKAGTGTAFATVEATGAEVAADWNDLRSGETYVGYDRADNFSSPGGLKHDKAQAYIAPGQLSLNHWALAGDWTAGRQGTVVNKANGRITFRFHARDVHLVMGPSVRGSAVRFRVRLDGKAPGAAHGSDIDAEGSGTVNEQRLYQLIRQPAPIADHEVEIEFLDPGAELFVFTFG